MDLIVAFGPSVIQLPKSEQQWINVSEKFELKAGFPDIGGAIDGSLFRIERPHEYDG